MVQTPAEQTSEPRDLPAAIAAPPPQPIAAAAVATVSAPPSEAAAVAAVAAPIAPDAAVAPAAVMEPPAPVAVLPDPVMAPAEELPLIVAQRELPRTKWLVMIAGAGLASGLGLGLMAMQLLSPAPKASLVAAPAAASRPAVAPAAPVVESAPPVAAPAAVAQTPTPAVPAEPKPSTPSSVIPWDDLPRASAKGCDELAVVGAGPKGFVLQQAVTGAQRALLQGDITAAHAAFCTAARIGVPSDTVLLGLTQVLLMQSDPTAALETIDQMLARAPTHKQALEWRGDILIRLGRVDEARAAWFKAAGATRTSKLLVDNLVRASDADAKMALRSGDLSRADRMLRRAIALTSGDAEHCRELVTVLTKSGQTAASERWRSYLSSLGG
jgi:hypothetical protein